MCIKYYLYEQTRVKKNNKKPTYTSTIIIFLARPNANVQLIRLYSLRMRARVTDGSNRARSSPLTGCGRQSLKFYSGKVFTNGHLTVHVMVVTEVRYIEKQPFCNLQQNVVHLCVRVSREPLLHPGFKNLPYCTFSTQGNVRVCW